MSKRHVWTIVEHNYLVRHAGQLTAIQIGENLDIPVAKVRDYARRKGISLVRHGSAIHNAKLNGLMVNMIVVLKDAGYTSNQIIEAFNLDVSQVTINDAVRGKTWTD